MTELEQVQKEASGVMIAAQCLCRGAGFPPTPPSIRNVLTELQGGAKTDHEIQVMVEAFGLLDQWVNELNERKSKK